MRKAAVRHGDPTTTRGLVIAYSSTIFDGGKRVALHGDEATCGNCEGTWKIAGTGEGMTEKGRCVVVDGDLVLCPCKKNRVIIGRDPGIFLECESGSGASVMRSAPRNTTQAAQAGYDEQVCAVGDGASEGYPYYIEISDGRTFSGRLAGDGRLPRIATQGEGDYFIYWGDEALARQEGI